MHVFIIKGAIATEGEFRENSKSAHKKVIDILFWNLEVLINISIHHVHVCV